MYVDTVLDGTVSISAQNIPPSPNVFIGWTGDTGWNAGWTNVGSSNISSIRFYASAFSQSQVLVDYSIDCSPSSSAGVVLGYAGGFNSPQGISIDATGTFAVVVSYRGCA
jgi:hypothetical protein